MRPLHVHVLHMGSSEILSPFISRLYLIRKEPDLDNYPHTWALQLQDLGPKTTIYGNHV